MSALDELKPTANLRVIDLVSAAGIDVSDWGKFKGGKKRAASNPKYCYEWAFVKPGSIVVLNLWYPDLRDRSGIVSANLNYRKSAQRYAEGKKGVWRARAERLDRALQEAAKNLLPVRVIVNEGRKRGNDINAEASRVECRLLDPVPWAVTSYDQKTGECLLTRGGLPERFVDQFSALADAEGEVERKTVVAMAFARDARLRERALLRAKGICEFCEKPGFAIANGSRFLETHHVVPLADGGPDKEENIAALCPNHHREAHYGARKDEIRQTLLDHLRHVISKSKA